MLVDDDDGYGWLYGQSHVHKATRNDMVYPDLMGGTRSCLMM